MARAKSTIPLDRAPAKCHCQSLPSSLTESEMPDGATSAFVALSEGGEYFTRCSACKQCWEFFFCGRHDIPTFQKLGYRETMAKIAAWDARQKEQAAAKAAQEAEMMAIFARQGDRMPHVRKKPSPFITRLVWALSMAGFTIGTILSFTMMFAGGEPPPQHLAWAGGAMVTGIAMALWYNLRIG